MEEFAEIAVEDNVGDRRDRHPVVVRIIIVDDGAPRPRGHAGRREIDRIVEAVTSQRSELLEALEVAERRQRVVLAGEDGRIGRNDRVLAKTALESERRYAEVGILIVQEMIAGVEGRFGYAPGRAQTAPVSDLLPDDEVVGLVQDTALPLLHHERRHQVFEHRTRPGYEGALGADRHHLSSQPVPVLVGQVALGDRKEAGQAAFGRKEVVAGLVQFVAVEPVSDGEKPAVLPEQEGEVHAEGDVAGRVRESDESPAKRLDRGVIENAVGDVRLADLHQFVRPVEQLLALRRLRFMMEINREFLDVAGQNGKIDDPDRRELVLALDGRQGIPEAVDALLYPSPKRADRLAVVRESLQRQGQDARDVADAVEARLQVRGGRFAPCPAGR